MDQVPELVPLLKQLCLSGILDSLDGRHRALRRAWPRSSSSARSVSARVISLKPSVTDIDL